MGRLQASALLLAGGLAIASGACSTDSEGVPETLPEASRPIERIVALVPAATETLVLLGAGDRLVGRTDYDTAQVVAALPSVGGGLQPNLEILRTLEPEVVVAFAGESDLRTAQVVTEMGIPVVEVRPSRIEDVRAMVGRLGRLVGAEDRADELLANIDETLAEVAAAVAPLAPVRFAYLLGGTPPLAAGPDTFLSELATLAGGVNVLGDLGALYAPVSPEVLRDRDIDVILMTRDSRIDPRILEGRRAAELPSWVEIPGPALGRSAWEVARALHPGLQEHAR
jgi:iron complex transport system substrate-binding protein